MDTWALSLLDPGNISKGISQGLTVQSIRFCDICQLAPQMNLQPKCGNNNRKKVLSVVLVLAAEHAWRSCVLWYKQPSCFRNSIPTSACNKLICKQMWHRCLEINSHMTALSYNPFSERAEPEEMTMDAFATREHDPSPGLSAGTSPPIKTQQMAVYMLNMEVRSKRQPE